jgi:DivIVA domain-containing protein
MELTPQRLREVEFKERWRGYDPEEVDDLLERVAAGLEDFESRVRQATERAVRAEQRASEGSDTDETLRRTLVLAQRTADAAIADAEARARELVADAEQRAAAMVTEAEQRSTTTVTDAEQRSTTAVTDAEQRAAAMVTDAEQRATAMVTDAEAEARRITDENETRLRENVSSLESARSKLQDDVDMLGRYLTDERERLRTALNALIARVDTDLQPDRSAPAVSEIEVPEPAPIAEEHAEAPADVADPAEADEPASIDLAEAERGPDGEGDATQAHDALAEDGGDAADVIHAGEGAVTGHANSETADSETAKADTADAISVDHDLVLSGPGRDIDTDDDAFFAQLRGALDDDEPLGPRDEEPVPNHVGAPGPPLFDQEVPEQGRLGPFLRRKRRDN